MIKLTNIQKKYGKTTVLSDVTLQIEPGQTVAVIGKNGCGKSTLLQIMAGSLKADSGSISYYGEDAVSHPEVFQTFCGYLPQDNPLMEQLNVKDNLLLWKNASCDLQEIITRFELTDILKKTVAQLSGGMKRRLAFSCACMGNPSVLLLDEPTTALDFYHKSAIREVLDKHRQNRGITVIITHDEEEIHTADRCLLIDNGSIREIDKKEINSHILTALYREKT